MNKLIGEGLRHVARDGEADTDAAAARRQNGGIDADKFAVEIQQRAAGVAAVNWGIGLNKVFQPFEIKAATTQRGDDAGSSGLPEAEGVANGNGEIADAQLVGIRDGDLR